LEIGIIKELDTSTKMRIIGLKDEGEKDQVSEKKQK